MVECLPGVRMIMGKWGVLVIIRGLILACRQLGLGSNVTLDTIIVPTEVVLWRFVPGSTESKCLDVKAGMQ